MYKHILLLISTIIIIGCGEKRNTSLITYDDSIVLIETITAFVNGKSIFNKHGNMCHSGPGARHDFIFDRIFERMPAPSEDYFIKFVGDSKSLKTNGDSYIKDMTGKLSTMNFDHNFKDSLSIQNFKDLIIYIRVGKKQPGNST